ncbi:MAG: 7-cyano-7-deazaguanine synthase QueC [Verrucomicrobiae bacterium]|nr:7-cyano-7-deazaguanine synthase QueC [Verrucomicrobiae bacterium]
MITVALVSGGMDSVAALYATAREHTVAAGLSFWYGAKHNDREIPFAEHHCRRLGIEHRVIRLDFMGKLFKSALLESGGAIPDGHYEESSMKQTVVPFRNGIMLSIAGGFAESAGAQGIVIAAHSGDHAIYPDCREEFMRSMADAMRLGTYAGIKILRPLIHLDKARIARLGHDLGVDFSQTWSCYKGGAIHCGACGTCVERREAFLDARLPDPTQYLDTSPLPPKPAARLPDAGKF